MLKSFIICVLITSLVMNVFGGEIGSQNVEKDECNPTGVGFSCQKLMKGLRMESKKVIIVPPRCPDGKRLDRNGKSKTISSEIVFEWFHLTEQIDGEISKLRATSFEYKNHKFYLTLVDKDKKTPGVGYVAWFVAGDDTSPKLNIYGDKNDYRMFNEKGHIMSPMLIRVDPCGDFWVMDANMYDISGEQTKEAPVFYIFEDEGVKHIFRDDDWNQKSVFMNIVFEVHNAVKEDPVRQCDPLAAYLADGNSFNLFVYHYHEDNSRKYSHPVRVHNPYHKLPSGYPRFLKGQHLPGVEGLTLVVTKKFGPLLMFHVLGDTMEYIIPLENRKNESSFHEKDIRVSIEKGANSEAGRMAYDPETDTLFFAEVKTKKIGFLNVRTALHEKFTETIYKRFDTRLSSGIITDIKVIGHDLWVLTSSESRITLEKEIISDIINEHKRRNSSPATSAVCEMLECTGAVFPKSNSNQFHLNIFVQIIFIFCILQ